MTEETERFCSICQDKDNRHWEKLPCGHQFHSNCIIQSLLYKSECPLCRYRTANQRVEDENEFGGVRLYFSEEALDDAVGEWLREVEEEEEQMGILQEARQSEWWSQLEEQFRDWNANFSEIQHVRDQLIEPHVRQVVQRRVNRIRRNLRNYRNRAEAQLRSNHSMIRLRNSHEERRRILGQVENFLRRRVPDWISREQVRVELNGLLQNTTGIPDTSPLSIWSSRNLQTEDALTDQVIHRTIHTPMPTISLELDSEEDN